MIRVNDQIRAPEVRIDGVIMSIVDARQLAYEQGTDLLEIVPNAKPPIVKLQAFGKYKYELQQKEKAARRLQKAAKVITKELRFRPNTGEHDLEILVRQGSKFLKHGDKLKLTLMVKGRERERIYEFVNSVRNLVDRFGDTSYVTEPSVSGRQISCTIQAK